EPVDGLGVQPPLGAPHAGLTQIAGVEVSEEVAEPRIERVVHQLRGFLGLALGAVLCFGGRIAHGFHPLLGPDGTVAVVAEAVTAAAGSCAGSCAAIEARTCSACGPLIQGIVSIRTGGVPEANRTARPRGSAASSAT